MSIGHKKDLIRHRGRNRKSRPKTFASEEAAKIWAEAHGIKEYSLVNLKIAENSQKKIRVVVKE